MKTHPVASRQEWLAESKALIELAKEFTQRRDEISQLHPALP